MHSLPSFRLDGQRALVAGAGRGIGAACAQALALAGAQVLVARRDLGDETHNVLGAQYPRFGRGGHDDAVPPVASLTPSSNALRQFSGKLFS